MQTKIDKSGRITLPKAMLLHLGIDMSSKLEINIEDNVIVIKMSVDGETTAIENGLLVYTGKAVGNLDSVLESIRGTSKELDTR